MEKAKKVGVIASLVVIWALLLTIFSGLMLMGCFYDGPPQKREPPPTLCEDYQKVLHTTLDIGDLVNRLGLPSRSSKVMQSLYPNTPPSLYDEHVFSCYNCNLTNLVKVYTDVDNGFLMGWQWLKPVVKCK